MTEMDKYRAGHASDMAKLYDEMQWFFDDAMLQGLEELKGRRLSRPDVSLLTRDRGKAMSVLDAAITKVQRLAEERVSPERAEEMAQKVRDLVEQKLRLDAGGR